jgi:serine/threonine protein kinase
MDIWSTGLILLSIMLGRTSTEFPNIAIPPLPCIENCFKSIPGNTKTRDINLTKLKQQQIDQDLNNLKLTCYDTEDEKIAIEGLRQMIREMLIIKPKKRISLNDTLSAFHNATAPLQMNL